jgi:hypothetical protein
MAQAGGESTPHDRDSTSLRDRALCLAGKAPLSPTIIVVATSALKPAG